MDKWDNLKLYYHDGTFQEFCLSGTPSTRQSVIHHPTWSCLTQKPVLSLIKLVVPSESSRSSPRSPVEVFHITYCQILLTGDAGDWTLFIVSAKQMFYQWARAPPNCSYKDRAAFLCHICLHANSMRCSPPTSPVERIRLYVVWKTGLQDCGMPVRLGNTEFSQ